MNGITYLSGDATAPETAGPKIVAHICNDIGGWGRGFVVAISNRWPAPEAAYRAWHAAGEAEDFGLGRVQFVAVDEDFWIANMVAQHKTRPAKDGRPPIRYDATETCLARVAEFAQAQGASVHMPRIGCGLAGGTWEEIEPLIERTCGVAGVGVWVYDFAPK